MRPSLPRSNSHEGCCGADSAKGRSSTRRNNQTRHTSQCGASRSGRYRSATRCRWGRLRGAAGTDAGRAECEHTTRHSVRSCGHVPLLNPHEMNHPLARKRLGPINDVVASLSRLRPALTLTGQGCFHDRICGVSKIHTHDAASSGPRPSRHPLSWVVNFPHHSQGGPEKMAQRRRSSGVCGSSAVMTPPALRPSPLRPSAPLVGFAPPPRPLWPPAPRPAPSRSVPRSACTTASSPG